MSNPNLSLSPEGQARRQRILTLALRESRKRRNRRAIVTGTLTGVGVLAMIGLIRFELAGKEISIPPVARHIAPIPITPSSTRPAVAVKKTHHPPPIVITRIHSDPHLTSRLATQGGAIKIRRIDDDQLLNQLAEAQQPAGLAYMNGKPMILFRQMK